MTNQIVNPDHPVHDVGELMHYMGEELYNVNTSNGVISIRKRGNSITYWQNGKINQTEVRLDGKSHGYTLRMALEIQKNSKVLVLGCGGGNLPTLLLKKGCEVTVVDIEPESFTLARKYFNMPEKGITCIISDAATYVNQCAIMYDVVVLDCYDGNGRPPNNFFNVGFATCLFNIINNRGLVIANYIKQDGLNVYLKHVGFEELDHRPELMYKKP